MPKPDHTCKLNSPILASLNSVACKDNATTNLVHDNKRVNQLRKYYRIFTLICFTAKHC